MFKDSKYTLHSVHAAWMMVEFGGAPKNMLDLASMFLDKQMKEYPAPGAVPPNIGRLNLKLLKAKEMWTEAIEFVRAHKDVFPIDLERSRMLIDIYRKAGMQDELIDECLSVIAKNC